MLDILIYYLKNKKVFNEKFIFIIKYKYIDSGVVIDDDDAEVAEVTNVARVGGVAVSGTTSSNINNNQVYINNS